MFDLEHEVIGDLARNKHAVRLSVTRLLRLELPVFEIKKKADERQRSMR